MPFTLSERQKQSMEWLGLCLIIAMALFFRLWRLAAVPPGLHYDEAIDLRQAFRILAGEHFLYATEGWGREAMFYYGVAGVLTFIGSNLLALRVTAVLFSLGSLLAAFFFARRWFGPLVAWLTAVWLAINYWPVSTARVGVRNITLPFAFGLAVWAFAWAWDKQTEGTVWQNRARYAFAGMLLGLSLYTYQPARFLPFLFVGFLGYLFLWHRPLFQAQWPAFGLFFVAMVVTAVPLALTILTSPPAEADRAWTIEPLTQLLAGHPQLALENGLATLKMFTFHGDPLVAYNVPGRPVFVPAWASLFFYAGLAIALWRWRQPRYAFLLLWLPVALLPTILTTSAPHFNRTITAQTAVFLLAALPVEFFVQFLATQAPTGVALLPIAVAGLALTQTAQATWHDYFVTWPAEPLLNVQYNTYLTAIGTYLQNTPNAGPVVINSRNIEDADPYILAQLLDRQDLTIRWVDTGQALAMPGGQTHARLIVAGERWVDAHLVNLVNLTAPQVSNANFSLYDLDWAEWPQSSPLPLFYLPEGAPWPAQPAQEALPLSLPINFGDDVQLEGLVLPQTTFQPGETLTFLSSWQVIREGRPIPLALFTHLLDSHEQVMAQYDGLGYPPQSWYAGDHFVQLHQLVLDMDVAPGDYWLQMGLYNRNDGRRWSILPTPDTALPGDRLLIGPITIR